MFVMAGQSELFDFLMHRQHDVECRFYAESCFKADNFGQAVDRGN